MACKVIRAFRHKNTGKFWRVGSSFDGTETQARELARKGFVEIGDDAVAETSDEEADVVAEGEAVKDVAAEGAAGGLEDMTVKELRALCGELGIDAPKKATEAELVALAAPALAEGE